MSGDALGGSNVEIEWLVARTRTEISGLECVNFHSPPPRGLISAVQRHLGRLRGELCRAIDYPDV